MTWFLKIVLMCINQLCIFSLNCTKHALYPQNNQFNSGTILLLSSCQNKTQKLYSHDTWSKEKLWHFTLSYCAKVKHIPSQWIQLYNWSSQFIETLIRFTVKSLSTWNKSFFFAVQLVSKRDITLSLCVLTSFVWVA